MLATHFHWWGRDDIKQKFASHCRSRIYFGLVKDTRNVLAVLKIQPCILQMKPQLVWILWNILLAKDHVDNCFNNPIQALRLLSLMVSEYILGCAYCDARLCHKYNDIWCDESKQKHEMRRIIAAFLFNRDGHKAQYLLWKEANIHDLERHDARKRSSFVTPGIYQVQPRESQGVQHLSQVERVENIPLWNSHGRKQKRSHILTRASKSQ